MFVVMLKFSDNKSAAGEFMEGHKAWLQQGFDDGVFLMAGSIKPGVGGSVIAHNLSSEALEKRVNDDPFVVENVVAPEIVELAPNRVDDRLAFLMQ